MSETVQELIAQRRGYKYLDSKGVSPYQDYTYDIKSRRQMTTELNTDPTYGCGKGWNLATLKWIADNCLRVDGIIIECSIPKMARIILPENSNGKFRTDKIKIKKVHEIESLFPYLKDLKSRLRDYKPTNPITAETMPPPSKVKKIMAQVRAQVGAQVGAQVWAQVGIITYYAISKLLGLDYDHPAFELIRLGVIVVSIQGKFKVFGKEGKYLGEIEALRGGEE